MEHICHLARLTVLKENWNLCSFLLYLALAGACTKSISQEGEKWKEETKIFQPEGGSQRRRWCEWMKKK